MTVKEMFIANYFVNILQKFYNENEKFKSTVDSGIYWGHADTNCGFDIDNVHCDMRAGCSRACFNFHLKDACDEMLDAYVVKIAMDLFDEHYLKTHDKQNLIEYNTYCVEKETSLAPYITEVIKGPLVSEVFPVEPLSAVHIYIEEKAKIDSKRYWNLAYRYCYTHLEEVIDEGYLDERDVEDPEIVEDGCWDYVNDCDGFENFCNICHELNCRPDDSATEKLKTMSDLHEYNIGFIGDRPVVVDYGFVSTDGKETYRE